MEGERGGRASCLWHSSRPEGRARSPKGACAPPRRHGLPKFFEPRMDTNEHEEHKVKFVFLCVHSCFLIFFFGIMFVGSTRRGGALCALGTPRPTQARASWRARAPALRFAKHYKNIMLFMLDKFHEICFIFTRFDASASGEATASFFKHNTRVPLDFCLSLHEN